MQEQPFSVIAYFSTTPNPLKNVPPPNNITNIKKKNNNSDPERNNPQLQKKITNSRKKKSKLSSFLPKNPIYIPPFQLI